MDVNFYKVDLEKVLNVNLGFSMVCYIVRLDVVGIVGCWLFFVWFNKDCK